MSAAASSVDSSRRAAFSRTAALRMFGALVSGGLLCAAFLAPDGAGAAWFALVPLLIATRFAAGAGEGFRLGMVAGLVFNLGTLAWLRRLGATGGPPALVYLGHCGLSAYCALYFGAFCAAFAALWKARGRACGSVPDTATPEDDDEGGDDSAITFANVLGDLAIEALGIVVWVALEYVRAHFGTGFAWNLLGVSQVRIPQVVQIASLGGTYAVSALVFAANIVLANVGVRLARVLTGRRMRAVHLDLMITGCAVAASIVWGSRQVARLERQSALGPFLWVEVSQADGPTVFQRDEQWRTAQNRLFEQTVTLAPLRPDLVVLPESAVFGWGAPDGAEVFVENLLAAVDAPLLAGTSEQGEEWLPRLGRHALGNASLLFRPGDSPLQVPDSDRYWKQHLVPFGEYVPGDKRFPWIERNSPVGVSCTPGRGPVFMSVPLRKDSPDGHSAPAVVSPLICFEDTVAELARDAVRGGATVLVNQSNDAWFSGTCEGFQHHAQAVFRAVETRTPLVRCANSGLSSVIRPSGRWSEPSRLFVEPVAPRDPSLPLPLYVRAGDWAFAIPCVAASAVMLALALARRQRNHRRNRPC